jgi:large subunit ribosomal protein L23
MENHTRDISELLSLVKCPSLTEKSVSLYGERQYTFIVDKSLTKTEIKEVLETIFDVTIVKVKTCMLPLKTRRVGRFSGTKARYKKTYVKLKEGDSITDLFT